MKLTLENLNKCLNNIGYTIKGGHPNVFIFDHNKENTHIRVWSDKLEIENDKGYKTIVSFNKCCIKMLFKDSVSIGNGKMFINLYNFSKK